jgi:hypothetical protein
MKTKQARQSNLVEGGRANLERTNQFKEKVEQIRNEVRALYSLTLLGEKNWARRIMIVIRREIEIRKMIARLSSSKNLHIAHN